MISRIPLEAIMPGALEAHGGTTYTVAEGLSSRVGVVSDAPNPYAVKVPSAGDTARVVRCLTEEYATVAHLRAAPGCPPAVPIPLHFSQDPLYAIFSKIEGVQLSPTIDAQAAAAGALSPIRQHKLGGDLGDFMAWQHTALTPTMFIEHVSTNSGPKPDFDAYYQEHLANFEHPAYPVLTALTRVYWERLAHYYPNGIFRNGDRVNHFDMQGHNIAHYSGKLTGVYDWEGVEIGNINQELRGAYRMGPLVLEAAVAALDRHHIAVDLAHVAFWAKLRTIGVFPSHIQRGTTDSTVFQQAVKSIKTLLPHEDWTELDPPRVIE